MASDRAELLRRVYAHFEADDFEAAAAHIHPDVEWHSSGVFPGLEPVYHGREAVRDWWRGIRDPFERFGVAIEDVWEAGDTVVTQVRFQAIGRESGVEVDLPFAHHFRFEGDVVVYYASYASVEEALAAAGLDPTSGASS